MLFLLTGDVQIGKTRWLESLCADIAAAGTCVAGVIAPGQWVPRPAEQPGGKHGLDGAGRFEKLGIDNVLLPQGARIAFARRRDLAREGQAFAEGRQAKDAQLAWAISDEAIAQVNAHFAALQTFAANRSQPSSAATGKPSAEMQGSVQPKSHRERPALQLKPGALLVVDELGRLELLRGCGLTNAVALLDGGPTPAFPHAITVVRETLLGEVCRRFAPAWGEPIVIAPDSKGRHRVLDAVCEDACVNTASVPAFVQAPSRTPAPLM